MKTLVYSAIILSSIGAAHGQSLRSQIEEYNGAVSAAIKKKDMATMAKMFRAGATRDFKYVENGTTMTMDQMVQNMGIGIAALTKVTVATTRVLSLKEHGTTAVSTEEYKMGGTLKLKDKKTHLMMSSGVATNTYVKVGGTWKIRKMVWGHEKMTLDGKPTTAGQMMGGGK